MNVALLFQEKEQAIDALLADGNWKRVDHYEIEPQHSNILGCAHVYSLARQITDKREVALVYLFLCLYMNGTLSSERTMPLTTTGLLNWLFAGGYIGSGGEVLESGPGSVQGNRMEPHIGWNKVQDGIRTLLENEQAHFYKNNQEIAPLMLFVDHQVKTLIAFKDYEKDDVFFDYLYFIETDKAWLYFSWGDVL